MVGKLMSISDPIMAHYYELLLYRPFRRTSTRWKRRRQLAREIVETYHGKEAAEKAVNDWTLRFSEKRLDEAELPAFAALTGDAVGIVVTAYAHAFKIEKSRSEATRLLKQGSIQLDGEKLLDPKASLSLSPARSCVSTRRTL